MPFLRTSTSFFGLLGIVVVLRHECVAAEPAVRGELAVLGAWIVRGFGVARHVAGLAGGDAVLAVEGKRRLLGEAGALPLVVDREGAQPLVIVEHARDSGFVAGGAEFSRFVERTHHSLGVAVEVGQDFGVGDGASNRRALLVHQDGRNAHHVAADSGGVGRLNRVAGGAGDAFVFERTLFGHALREIAGEQGDRVMATFAVAGELHALLVDHHVDVLQIPGGAEAVGVHRLPPLVVGLFVAMPAVFGRVEALRALKLAVGRHGVGGQERRFFAERVVVAAGDGVVKRRGWPGNLDGRRVRSPGVGGVGRGGSCNSSRVGRGTHGPGNRQAPDNNSSSQQPGAQCRLEHGPVISGEVTHAPARRVYCAYGNTRTVTGPGCRLSSILRWRRQGRHGDAARVQPAVHNVG
jgi:hypothetical protein